MGKAAFVVLLASLLLVMTGCEAPPDHSESRADGSLLRTGYLVDGRRHGTWKEYHPDGSRWSAALYEQGRVQRVQAWRPDGSMVCAFELTDSNPIDPRFELVIYGADGDEISSIRNDGSRPSGNIIAAYQEMAASVSEDMAIAMRMAAVPFNFLELGRGALQALTWD
jgi:hypothetical protein